MASFLPSRRGLARRGEKGYKDKALTAHILISKELQL